MYSLPVIPPDEHPNIEINEAMINDFVLKFMELNTATLDLKDFTFAILTGYVESLFDLKGEHIVREVKN